MEDKSASGQIDDIIKKHGSWKGEMLARLRVLINEADPRIVEEVKWKMPSRPEGLPVWSYKGTVCIAQTFKDNIKLDFFKGALLKDPTGLFNARLKSKMDRAIELHAGDTVDEGALKTLVVEAVKLNESKVK